MKNLIFLWSRNFLSRSYEKLLAFLLIFLFAFPVLANGFPDADKDGVPDKDEIEIYQTNPDNRDTDGDGLSDWVELNKGYSPHNPKPVKLKDNDFDQDGLKDNMELKFHTSIINPDTDGDGHKDGEEVRNGYDPLTNHNSKLPKKIEVNTAKQELYYYLGRVKMGTFKVSSGKATTPTPKGSFAIVNKTSRAWSPYGLWMPYWMGLYNGSFGLHELPYWPNGYREGQSHLGIPVSHGCIRLGIGDAKTLYEWAPVGTPVLIY